MTPARAPLREALASPDAKRTYVRRLFATIADRYDLITVLLSYGQDRRWKRRVAALAAAAPGSRVLDLACGTGDIAFEVARGGARVTGLDITHRMLELARRKTPDATRGRVTFLTGDMMALPFAGPQFDVVTTGYGIRNVPDLVGALAEIRRVLRPGGVFVSLDFDRPSQPLVRGVYLAYLGAVGSVLGLALHGDPDTYRYIPASIQRYPGAHHVAELLREIGFSSAEVVPVFGGLMAIHRAVR